jgi:ferritin-like metal-binding protein YciE
VRTFATLLGYEEAAALLQETLDEEAEADHKLTELAETVINADAESEGDEEEEEEEEEEESPKTSRGRK